MSLVGSAIAELADWQAPNADQERLRTSYLAFLADCPAGWSRDCLPDHLTAGLLVVSADRRRVLLNLHGRFGRWMQFGGHLEASDATLAQAALREGAEESGLLGLALVGDGPVQLSRHRVRCGTVFPVHHLEVRYVAVVDADADAVPVVSSESQDVRWFAVDGLPAGLEPEVVDLVAVARRL